MKKLDWYISKKFLSTFFFSIILFTIISIVIDISEKADDFVKSKLSVSQIIMQYYIGFIPHIMALLFPLFVFISVIFFTSKMAAKSETISILASGISYNRWLRPYLLSSIFLALILWFANQIVVPNANKIRSSFETVYVDGNSSYENLVKSRNTVASDLYIRIDSSTYAGIYNYDTISKRGGPFFLYALHGNQLKKNIRAEAIVWDAKEKKWKLEQVMTRSIDSIAEKTDYKIADKINFYFKPADLAHDKYTKDKLTSNELKHFIALEEQRGAENLNELKVEINRRNATPFSVILLTLIGAFAAGRKVRGGSGFQIAVGFITAAIFILTDKFSTVFSTKGDFPPVLAAWTPNFVFSLVAFYFYKKAPK